MRRTVSQHDFTRHRSGGVFWNAGASAHILRDMIPLLPRHMANATRLATPGIMLLLACLMAGHAAATAAQPPVQPTHLAPSVQQEAPHPAGASAPATPPRGLESGQTIPDAAAVVAAGLVQQRRELRSKVMEAARSAGMPPELADAVATVESNYNTSAIGGVGEIGLMQVLPSTARMLGFGGTLTELAEPDNNIRYGVRYLSQAWRQAGGDICTTVMKYRAGHGESRFSHRSVAYCVRVRTHLASMGYKVTGEVPLASFGARTGVVTGSAPGRRAGARRSRYNWAAADARMKSIAGKVTSTALMIAH